MRFHRTPATLATTIGLAVALIAAGPAAADAVRRQQLTAPVSSELTSGLLTSLAADNIKSTNVLTPESRRTYDSSWNRYSYVLNNPVRYTDPTGEFVFSFGVAVAVGVIFGVLAPSSAEYANNPTGPNDACAQEGNTQFNNSGGMRAAGPVAVGVATGIAMTATDIQPVPSHESAPSFTQGAQQSRTKKVTAAEGATGAHTSFKTDDSGKVTGYTEYDAQGRPVKRFRGQGSGQGRSSHGGIEPPLILEPKKGKGPGSPPKIARKPRPDELPLGYGD